MAQCMYELVFSDDDDDECNASLLANRRPPKEPFTPPRTDILRLLPCVYNKNMFCHTQSVTKSDFLWQALPAFEKPGRHSAGSWKPAAGFQEPAESRLEEICHVQHSATFYLACLLLIAIGRLIKLVYRYKTHVLQVILSTRVKSNNAPNSRLLGVFAGFWHV